MKFIKAIFLGIIFAISLATNSIAGVWATNNFVYEPSYGESGTTSYNNFTTGLTRIDTRLGYEIWVGDPNYGTTLQSAITAIGNGQAILHLPRGTYSITSNLTIPTNISLIIERGAVVSIADATTVTIRASFDVGLYQVFSCTGTGRVVFSSGAIKEIYPEWWGAVADDRTDCLSAIQAAVDTGGKVKLSSGIYRLSGTLKFNTLTPNRVQGHLIGQGWNNTTIRFLNTTGPGILINYDSVGMPSLILEGLNLRGPGTQGSADNHGIYLPGGTGKVISDLKIDKCRIMLWGGDDIRLQGPTGPVRIKDCYLYDCGGNGITITADANNVSPQDLTINGGAIQGTIAGGGIFVDGAAGTVSALSIYEVDLELRSTSKKPALYFRNCFGPVILGVTAAHSAATLTFGDAVVYIDDGVIGASFINLLTNAAGGLHNFDFAGSGHNNSIIGGFHYSNPSPSPGLGYFVKISRAARTSILNPSLSKGTYASNHDKVFDSSIYGQGLLIHGVSVIRDPETSDEIIFHPKTFLLAKHTEWNPGTLSPLTATTTTIPIKGAYTNSNVEVFQRSTAGNVHGMLFSAYVSNIDQVTVTIFNGNASNKTFVDPIPLDIYVYVPMQ